MFEDAARKNTGLGLTGRIGVVVGECPHVSVRVPDRDVAVAAIPGKAQRFRHEGRAQPVFFSDYLAII